MTTEFQPNGEVLPLSDAEEAAFRVGIEAMHGVSPQFQEMVDRFIFTLDGRIATQAQVIDKQWDNIWGYCGELAQIILDKDSLEARQVALEALVRPLVCWYVGLEKTGPEQPDKDGYSGCLWCSGVGKKGDTALAAIEHKADCQVAAALSLLRAGAGMTPAYDFLLRDDEGNAIEGQFHPDDPIGWERPGRSPAAVKGGPREQASLEAEGMLGTNGAARPREGDARMAAWEDEIAAARVLALAVKHWEAVDNAHPKANIQVTNPDGQGNPEEIQITWDAEFSEAVNQVRALADDFLARVGAEEGTR